MSRCFNCLKEFPDKLNICPFCGSSHLSDPTQPVDLYPGTVMFNRYFIGRSISSGGFGILYKAYDMQSETIVAIKEFYPASIATRAEGTADVIVSKKHCQEYHYRKGRFLAEARNMARFGSHKNIPNVFEFFEANNTAYIVMEFLEGESLSECLYRNKTCPIEFAVYIVNEVGKALISMHKEGIIHKDVAPDNIFLGNSGNDIKLLDLGAAKLKDYKEDILDMIVKPGYSPPEQYDKSYTKIDWSADVYSLGATFYAMLTGIKPDESRNRAVSDKVLYPHQINPNISENLSNTIMKAMAVDVHMRFRTVKEFLKAVNGEVKIIPVEKEKKKRKLRRFTGIAAAVLILIAGGIIFALSYKNQLDQETLPPADIEIWISVKDGSKETDAIKNISEQFHKSYPDINITIKVFPESDYNKKIEEAAANNSLPAIFESTDVSADVLENAQDVTRILKSAEAKDCLFLAQYDNYYQDKKRLPLGIEVPVAYVITRGPVYVDYNEDYFSDISDFNTNKIAVSKSYKELVYSAFDLSGFTTVSENMFLNQKKCAVLLSSTMQQRNVFDKMRSCDKKCVFCNSDNIKCRFTYEWSIGNGNGSEIKAAEKLLSWMLGNAFQYELMINCSEGQIPINKTAFNEKISHDFKPISEIYDKFVFDRKTKEE